MVRRLIYLGVVAALLVVGDVATRGFVESTVNTRAQQEAPPDSTVTASIDGFPFLPRLIFSSEVKHASVHIANISAQVLVFAEVDIDLSGVHLDRGRLINDRKARITGIDHGKITAVLTADALSDALHGAPVTMADGKVTVSGVSVTPTIRNDRLAIGGLVIPPVPFVPCVSAVAVQSGRLQLSCEIDEVPPALLDAVQEAVDN
jgi:hypothetical protein